MTTVYEWNSTADTGWSSTVGTSPTNETAGTYGERWKWPDTTAQAYGIRSGLSLGNFGVRFIYRFTGMTTPTAVSFSVFQGRSDSTTNLFRCDMTTSSYIRIRDAANTTLSTGTVALTAGTEYRFEISRSSTTLTFKVYDLSDNLVDSITGTIASTTVERFLFGNNASITGNTLPIFTMDGIKITDVAGDVGPISTGPPALRVTELSGSLSLEVPELRLRSISGTVNASGGFASAGPDLSRIEPGDTVTLDGSGSTGSTFAWTVYSYDSPAAPTITNSSSQVASYVAPDSTTDVTLVFRLTVNGTLTDDVIHQVEPRIEWRYVTGTGWVPMDYRL